MLKKRIITIALAFIIIITTGVLLAANARSNKNTEKKITIHNQTEENAINSFDSKLFSVLCNQSQNVNYSALSIYSILYALSKGSDGNTREEINSVLEYTPSQANDEFIKNIITTTENISNSVWYNKDITFRKEYKTFLEDFEFEQKPVDFTKGSQVKRKINSFVSKKTDRLIKNFLSSPLPQSTKLVLLNTLFFEQEWKYKFEKKMTKEEDFYVDGSTIIKHDMMRGCRMIDYYEDYDFQIAAIPYKDLRYSMIIILPKDRDYDFSKMNLIEVLTTFKKNKSERLVNLFLPKFEKRSSYDLIPILKKLGINDAFNSAKADLSKIFEGSEKILLDQALHEAVIKVDEDKTKAAAATMVMAKAAGDFISPDDINFRADHPFTYVIYDAQSGINLFTGIVRSPD